jgi:putative solute:sodium symporter small subunit
MSADQYEVNLFKPKTAYTKANMKIIIVMIGIWAVAVFGFQFLMIAINKPTPEPTYQEFTAVWPAIENGNATTAQKQSFARVVLMVLGKNHMLKAGAGENNHKNVLKEALSVTVNELTAATGKEDPAAAIGLGTDKFDPLLADVLASSIVPIENGALPDEARKAFPAMMERYLVHNQSVLTDSKFLGFPFHYWYTAQFLLILFVALCGIFCYVIDKYNHKFQVEKD